jgi:hypothetical protein
MWFEIRVRGLLSPDWSEWFEGLEIRPERGAETVLAGPFADQPALHGCLARIRDLNLTLISVNEIAPLDSPEARRNKERDR